MQHDEIIVDSFAGGGGASTGIEMALSRSPDIAINHDVEAVAMHTANHPDTEHYCQNVWQIDPMDAVRGRKVGLAWFSPDCKHFSKAKGGAPVKRNIRDLAWVVVLWAKRVKPRVIMLENVEEFKTWGPLGDDGRPCPIQKGITFKRWVQELKKAGYKVEWRELRACDYGAPTIRKRLFVIARRDGLPIVWPAPTHGDPRKAGFEASGLLLWRTAADIIDWSLPCPSIFMDKLEVQAWFEKTGQRLKRPLADATEKRISRGLQRFVFDNPVPFIVRTDMASAADRNGVHDQNAPVNTLTTGGSFAVVAPYVTKFRKGSAGADISEPMPTITASSFEKRPGGNPPLAIVAPVLTEHANASGQRTFPANEPLRTQCANVKGGHFAVIAPSLASYYGTKDGDDLRTPAIDEPLRTQTTENRFALCSAFMAKHFGGMVGTTLDKPAPTCLTSGAQNQLVTAHIERQFGRSAGNDAQDPLGTVTAGGDGKAAVVTSHLAKLRGTCRDGQETAEPVPAITAGGTHVAEVRAFLTKYYGNGDNTTGVDEPMHTVTAKDRVGLVTVQGVEYQLVDIGMRMLTPAELYRAQGFPETYIIDRTADGKPLTKTAQVRMCGNSVCPPLAAALVRANLADLAVAEAAE